MFSFSSSEISVEIISKAFSNLSTFCIFTFLFVITVFTISSTFETSNVEAADISNSCLSE